MSLSAHPHPTSTLEVLLTKREHFHTKIWQNHKLNL